MIVLAFPDYHAPAARLAKALHVSHANVEVHHFPDGESRIRLPLPLPPTVIICRSLNQPNDKLIELVLTCETARSHGVKRILLVAPYLCYLRQDAAFHPGEAVSERIIGQLLAAYVDGVITVDAHLHRITSLSQAIPGKLAVNTTAATTIAAYIANNVDNPIILGPDEESQQWVNVIAQHISGEAAVARKQRYGDRNVSVVLPNTDFSGRNIVIVDDMVSTGTTIAETARCLRQASAAAIYCAVTHPMFVGEALTTLQNAGIKEIWSTDSLLHTTNRIELATVLAQAVPPTL